MPKAASTTLQQQVFARLTSVDYHALERKGGLHGEQGTFAEIRHLFASSNGLARDLTSYRDWWSQIAQADDRRRLVSVERFSTHYGLTLALNRKFCGRFSVPPTYYS